VTRSKFISLKKAIQIAISHSKRTKKSSKIDLAKSLNFISSKEIRSPMNLPELDSAGLDGFIISNKKFSKIPVSSKIIETGKVYKNLSINYTYRINTGASIPDKFKNFISLENAFIENNSLILSKSKISDKDIKKKAEDLKKNQILIKKNQKINFIKLALLGSVGIKKIDICRPLKVGVISTGNELIDYKKKKKDFQTFDSNKLQIINFLRKYPISINDLGILKDNFKDVEKFYKTKNSQYDLIISSGGSSFSSGDHTSSYLTKNSKILFQYLRIQPGRPIIFAKRNGQYIFSLPGNPLAVMVNLKLIISKFLDPNNLYSNFKIENFKSGFNENKKVNITKFIRVKIKGKTAFEHNSKGSAKLISTAQSDGFLIVEEGLSRVIKGKSYPVIKFEI
jgi:molybdopterin molybdotransferase